MGTLDSSGQFLSSSRADFIIAAAQLCFLNHGDNNPADLSRCISEKVGRPLLVVNLAELPHQTFPGSTDCRLTQDQTRDHAKIFEGLAQEAFATGKGFPDAWDWMETGQLHTVSSSSWRTDDPLPSELPTRLHGNYWTKAAVITTANRLWHNRELWLQISGLKPYELEYYPEGDAVRAYNLGHEICHTLQLAPSQILENSAWQWETEGDSDEGSFNGLSLLIHDEDKNSQNYKFAETIEAVKHGRALSAFRAAFSHYHLALRLDGQNVDCQKSKLCTYELRFRTYAALKSFELSLSSQELQFLIQRWMRKKNCAAPLIEKLEHAFSARWDWGLNNDLSRSIPALSKILDNGTLTDPLTIKNAQLIIEAALFFCPSLQSLLPATSFRPHTQLPSFTPERMEALPQFAHR